MRGRPRRGRVEPLADLMAATMKRLGRSQELLEPRALVAWEEVAGARVAARTRPERLRAGVLLVRVDGSAWLQELSYLKPDLRERLNQALGEEVVRDIRFVPGTGPRRPPRPAAPAPAPEPPPVSPAELARIAAETAAIGDPALREAMVALRAKLSRRR